MRTIIVLAVLVITAGAQAADKQTVTTIKPIYPDANSYVLRDGAGKRVGTATKAPWSDDTLVLRDTQGRRTGTIKAK